MFGHRKQATPDQQIPYTVYETLQRGHARRYQWLYEITIAVIIVLILSLGAVLTYRLVHKPKTPTSTTHSANVIQRPQATVSPTTQSPGAPSSTTTSNSTNTSNVPEPKN